MIIDSSQFRWSVLPPLALMGLGTGMVESAEHYVARLAWTVGLSVRALCPPVRDASGILQRAQAMGASGFCGPGRQFKRRVEHLERLTGVEHIRHGTFWVVDDLLAVTGVGRDTKRQRWCPQCFLEWDEEHSYEPLIWMVDVQQSCPVHGCALEAACRACSSFQPTGRDYRRRRHCYRCGQGLAGLGKLATRPTHHIWAEHTLAGLIALCATPGQPQIPYEKYERFVRGLIEISLDQPNLPATLRAAMARLRSNAIRGRVTLRTLVNLSALQGITIPQMLLDPVTAASRPLIDLWSGYQALEFPSGRHGTKVVAFRQCIREILSKCGERYVPPMKFVLRSMKINRDLAREMCVDVYEDYEAAYQRQGGYQSRLHRDRAFVLALRMIGQNNQSPFAPCDARKVARQAAKAARVSLADAEAATRSAIHSSRALERAKGAMLCSIKDDSSS